MCVSHHQGDVDSSVSPPERLPAAPAEGNRGAFFDGEQRLPGHVEPAGGGDPGPEGGDGAAAAGAPRPSQRQACVGPGDHHLQEATGGRGEQVTTTGSQRSKVPL